METPHWGNLSLLRADKVLDCVPNLGQGRRPEWNHHAWWFSVWRFPLVCCSKPCLLYLDELTKVQILRKFRTLSCIVLFLASKCYVPALVWYPANVWVRMCFGRFAVTLPCIYWATVFRAPLKSSLKENSTEEMQNALLIQFLMVNAPWISLW